VAVAGEVNQAIGRAYQFAFIAALEGSIKHFENKFTVERAPEKTSFLGRSGASFSFDFNGVYSHPWRSCEVFGECKGYSKAYDLLNEFRLFVAKSYVASADTVRNRQDMFWFVTNVPFGCSEGSSIRNFDFVMRTLTEKPNHEVREIVGNGNIDEAFVRSLVRNIGVFILTDSYLMNANLSYKVESGESLWVILKKFHAGTAPSDFRAKAEQISVDNGLPSPDRVRSGKRLSLPWYGLRS
jgi:hypothetical protein